MKHPAEHSGTLRTLPEDPSVSMTTFGNGLKVIIKEDHRTPVAICHVWVRVGSNREPDDRRGWAHGIEHMIFKGTSRRQESDFAREVAEAGGSTNAGTGYETTSYHILIPRENLGIACDILGDAVFGATFDPAALDAERQVLVHENHMYDDIPSGFGVTWRWGLELAFDSSPYKHPIGGRDEQLLEVPREDILSFFQSAYRPDNMTVVVAGDVDPVAACDLVRKKFGRAAGQQTALPQPPVDPPQTGLRFRFERGDIQQAYVKLVFRAPAATAPEYPVQDVIDHILSDGRSCRLYRVVQEEKQLVSDISIMTENGPREGVFVLDFETDPERLPAALVATAEVLEQLRQQPCTEQELSRARIRVERSYQLNAETVQGQSSNLGYHDAMGDLAGAFEFPERVRAVTRERVQELSTDLFRLSNLSCLIYMPKDAPAGMSDVPETLEQAYNLLSPVLGDAEASTPGPDAEPDPAEDFTRTGSSSPARRQGKKAPTVAGDFQSACLDSGIPVQLRVDRTLPVVALAMQVVGGTRNETAAQCGLAALCQQVRVKGTGDLNAESIHEFIEERGVALAPNSDRDSTGLFLTGLNTHLDEVLELVGELACAPSFPVAEIDQERALALDQLRALADDPFQFAALALRKMIYGDQHPYGRPLIGTEDSLANITQAELLEYHASAWTTGNLQIVVSGDVDPDHLLPGLQQALAGLPTRRESTWPDLKTETRPSGKVRERLIRDQNQGIVLVGWPGQQSPAHDRVELLLLKELLNGQSGRLFEALRNRRSLCYNTGILSTFGFGTGMVVGYILTDPDSTGQALDTMCDEFARLSAEPIDEQEFARAKTELKGNLLISNQANNSRVARCCRDILYGRSANDLPELIESITACGAEQVQAAAARYFDLDNRYEVILGPTKK